MDEGDRDDGGPAGHADLLEEAGRRGGARGERPSFVGGGAHGGGSKGGVGKAHACLWFGKKKE